MENYPHEDETHNQPTPMPPANDTPQPDAQLDATPNTAGAAMPTPVQSIVTTPVAFTAPAGVSPASSQPAEPTPAAPSPGIVVLQWLTYAFWGWTLLALSALIFIVIFNLINHSNTGNTSLYTLAAIVVLLPISLICDLIYQKHELKKKQGVSMAVMVIHAVIFALFAIGALISSLFSVVQLLVNSGSSDTTNSNIALFVSLIIIALLYSFTFLRTLNPLKTDLKLARIFDVTMLVIIGIFTILAFIGPFAQSLQTKNDRLIEATITSIKSDVDSYIRTNNKLPASLNDISLQNDAQQLVNKDLVTYKQDAADLASGDFHYQLCAHYTQKDTSRSYGYSSYSTNEYSSYISTAGHGSGEVCYKLATPNYNAHATVSPLFN